MAGAVAVANTGGAAAPEYEAMQALEGEWAGSSKVYIAPGMPPESSGGKISSKMIGDFWLAEHATGQVFGKPFERFFVIGLDANSGGVTGSLVSSGDKASRPLQGSYDSRTSTWTLNHEMLDAGGSVIQARTTIQVDRRKGTKSLRTFHLLEEGFNTVVLDMQTSLRAER
ncbi:MAG: DUF1579 family protein [Planctomycetota bacterium]|nr:DUF1579 family protein [Planctomycetota bacterium]